MIAQMPPMGVVKVELYDTPTEYRLADLYQNEKRITKNLRVRLAILLVLNFVMFLDIMYLVWR